MTAEAMVEIRDLHVRYRTTQAVQGLSFSVARGEVFGLLGPNGAGKSSTLACIQGLGRPAAGQVLVAGYDVGRHEAAVKAILGIQPQKTALFNELRAYELIELYAAFYERYPSRAEIMELLNRFGLSQKADAHPDKLSGGQQQRLSLALAVVNDPQIVLLDEPSTGLDPQARRGVWATIKHMQAEGRTILLTTHYMEEAQELCDRVGIVTEGRLVAIGTPQELIERYAALSPAEAARRQPNLEDVFLALTGRSLSGEGVDLEHEQMTLSSASY